MAMVLFKYCLGYPLFLFCDEKVPWVLLKNYEIHPPTLWVLLGMCSIKKYLYPAHNTITSNRDISKTTLGTFFEKTIQARVLRLGSYGRNWALICAKISFCRYLKN